MSDKIRTQWGIDQGYRGIVPSLSGPYRIYSQVNNHQKLAVKLSLSEGSHKRQGRMLLRAITQDHNGAIYVEGSQFFDFMNILDDASRAVALVMKKNTKSLYHTAPERLVPTMQKILDKNTMNSLSFPPLIWKAVRDDLAPISILNHESSSDHWRNLPITASFYQLGAHPPLAQSLFAPRPRPQ